MTKNEFQKLLALAESEILDFKQEGYDLEQNKGRSALSKDVLAMANTPRNQSARIVFGVNWTPESGSDIVGLNRQFDDVDLQNAFIRKRIHPVPRFIYTPLELEGKQVGVIEIPVNNDGPYIPLTDSEELRAGVIYYRRGTQNDTAVGTHVETLLLGFKADPQIFTKIQK